MRMLRFIFLIFTFSVFSQEKDSLYIENYSYKINVKTSLELEEQALEVTNLNTLNNYSLRQNEVGKLALSLNYDILGIKIGFSPDFLKNDFALKGPAQYRHYRIRIYFPKLYQQFYYYRTKGFYVKNTEDHLENWEKGKDPYLQISNLNTLEIGGETRYYFSNKFGYRAIFSNTERQLKSKGTWMGLLKYNYSKIDKTSKDYFMLDDESYNISLMGGYVYNLIFDNNKYLFGQITPSIGLKYVRNMHDNSSGGIENDHLLIPNIGLRTRLGLGYNSSKFYYGVSVLITSTSYQEYSNIDLVDSRIFASIHLGYRFKAFKGLERLFQKIGL
ncbi:DUF4421 family protein [Wenyingzhuangia sp. chi5]|uniref:DUF4421 family protein n=1 Tax=Wenyingzhuangia gilva TaxID=3057677 RepID=A0ABT8VT87_9FLAO|nr:DUF4421 family protein [Wenyingzhuangia sp. chi5]MDO3695190.1 DUF4421 family protein [Wenyingzhuangia sp. chi5]